MSYISRGYLKRMANLTYDSDTMNKIAAKVLLEAEEAFPKHGYIFISHSYIDKPTALEVATMFNNLGYESYIDWQDQSLPYREDVSPDTAEVLRNNIKFSCALIYVASQGSSDSKWMPWELGLADGMKRNTAIMPLVYTEDDKLEDGREYLGLYPEIITSDLGLQVRRPDGKRAIFHDWINGRPIWRFWR